MHREAAPVNSKPIFDAEMGGPSGKLQKVVDTRSDIDPDPHFSPLYGDHQWDRDYQRLVGGRHGFPGGYQAELDDVGGVSYHRGGIWTNHLGKRTPIAHVIKPVLAANPDRMVASDPAQEVQYLGVSSIPGDEGQVYRTLQEAVGRPQSLGNRWEHPGRGYEPRPLSEGFMAQQRRGAFFDDEDEEGNPIHEPDADLSINIDPEWLNKFDEFQQQVQHEREMLERERDREHVEHVFNEHGEDYEDRMRRLEEASKREFDKPEFPGAQWRKLYPNVGKDLPGHGYLPIDTGMEPWQGSKTRIQRDTVPLINPQEQLRVAPWDERKLDPPMKRLNAVSPDESGLKAAGIAVIALDTGRVLMQQRALNPLHCPCGLGVTWDEQNGYQHDDGSVDHDGEYHGQSVSDLLDQGHTNSEDGTGADQGVSKYNDLEGSDETGFDKTAALEFDPNEGTWEFPGGKIDPGEAPRDAATREFKEEVGQPLPPGVFVGAWVSPGGFSVTAAKALHVAASLEPPQEHVESLLLSGWKPRPEGDSEAYPDFTRLSPTTGINHQLNWARDTGDAWMYDASVPDENVGMGRRAVNPDHIDRVMGGRGSIALEDPTAVNQTAKQFERDYLLGSPHGEPGIAQQFNNRQTFEDRYGDETPRADRPNYDPEPLKMRSEPAFERSREGDPLAGTHPEPDVSYREFNPSLPGQPWVEGLHHNFEDDRPIMNAQWGIEKLNSVSPVYKGFIYLIQRERDIDLGNREIANPDDPDGDMTEQSAWWEIEHAKDNPALREECKEGTPWDELEMWADKSVRENKQIKEALARLAAEKCKYCKSPATNTITHSEGMGKVPVCAKHLGKGKEDAANCTPDGSHDPSNINSVKTASGYPSGYPEDYVDPRPKLPEGLRYHDAPDQPYQSVGNEDFWRFQDPTLIPPLNQTMTQGYQIGQGLAHPRAVDVQPMIVTKPQSDYVNEEHFDEAPVSSPRFGPKTEVKWDDPICENCYLKYGDLIPAWKHNTAMKRYYDDLGEEKHEFEPMNPEFVNGKLKEARVAMPLTQDEPVVRRIIPSGEGSLNRDVMMPSGNWIAKTLEDRQLRSATTPEAREKHLRSADKMANMEEFASRLGRALSDREDEPLVPEVVRSAKASDLTPTVYVRRYDNFRDLLEPEGEQYVNTPRGKQMGYLHGVLGDSDKGYFANTGIIGDKIISHDHTLGTLPEYADALKNGDQGRANLMRWNHDFVKPSPFERHFFYQPDAVTVAPVMRNPLAPGDTERAVAAAETMRPWARERGIEHWVDAAQDRMRGLGEYAAGTTSMFPHQMAHEQSQVHVGSAKVPWWSIEGDLPRSEEPEPEPAWMKEHDPEAVIKDKNPEDALPWWATA
jgi:hypothetical protein